MNRFTSWSISFAAVVATLWLGFAGWYAFACGDEPSRGFGWGLFALLVSPIEYPVLGLLVVASLVAGPLALAKKALEPNGIWRISLLMLPLAISGCALMYLCSKFLGATARCSFGF